MICKYCGKEIPKGEVWNPDGNGNGYHHRCLIDMEFDENETYIENLKNRSIIIPDGATNGDMIKAMFPNCEQKEHANNGYFEMYFDNDLKNASYMRVSKDWWNAPYKKEVEE